MQGTGTGNQSLSFWANVNDASNREVFSLAIETETGAPLRMVLKDRETLEPLMVIHVPLLASNSIGQALMLGAAMKAEDIARGG